MNKQKAQDVSGAKVRYHSAQLPMGCGTAGHPELEEAIIMDGIFQGISIVGYTYMYVCIYIYILPRKLTNEIVGLEDKLSFLFFRKFALLNEGKAHSFVFGDVPLGWRMVEAL